MQYKAQIEFRATEDNFEEGIISSNPSNVWEETLYADTQSELRNKILEATYSQWADLNDEQINEYDWCTEYSTSYLANEANEGKATDAEYESWKLGKTRLWDVECHILVTKVTETKASL